MTAPAPPTGPRPSAAQLAALAALVAAQAKLRQDLTRTAVAAALAPFRAFTGWWDPAKVSKAIAEALRVVQPTQRQAARVTDAYLARVASTMTGRTVPPAGAVDVDRLRRQITARIARDLVAGKITPAYVVLGEFDPATGHVTPAKTINAPAALAIPETAKSSTSAKAVSSTREQAVQLRAAAREQARALRDGTPVPAQTPATAKSSTSAASAVDAAGPYGRIADQYRYQVVAEGVPEERARRRALVRIEAVATTDVILAVREQVRASLGKIKGIEGYRRILRPELSETGPCGLCVVAADRVYRIEDLMPLHDRCCCDVLPVIGDLDPGLWLNRDDLDRIYQAAGSTGGGKRQGGALKKIRVALAEHGELGPTLVDADQHHRGPLEVARTKHPDKAVRDAAKLDAFEERLVALLRRRARGEDVDRAVEWQNARIEKLRRDLGAEPAPSAAARVRQTAGA